MKHLRIKINSLEIDWEYILKDIDFLLNEKDRIALVWWNWVWKTSLMKILTWEYKDYNWWIENIWNLTIWYLSQIYSDNEEKTVREELKDWFKDICILEKELNVIEKKMSDTPEDINIIEEYTSLLERFNNIWWYNYNNQIHNVSSWMQILELLEKKLSEISWWQRTKVALCKILLESPDILLLDEPTNFIDMKSVEWLESFLQNKWNWWYFIISHDREFLDKTCHKTYELQPQRQLKFYHSNYTWYIEEREKNESKWNENYKRQQDFIKKEETLINRFRAWSRASFAKSREKALDRLDRIIPPYISKKPKFFFNYSEESNERIFYFKQVFIWRKEPLFFINDLSFQKWQRVWIVWENWAWKSTFIKTILWELDVLDWLYLKWKWLQILYYSQLHEELDKEMTVRQNFEKSWIFYPDQQLIWYLKHYLIDKSHIDKKVKYLSWWQISKVLFAILWQKESNVLIFDEPTNHLDYDTREALEKELNNYKWSILFISHDRYFVNKLATNIWFIENEELSVSYWNYEDYLFKQQNWLSMDMSMFQESAELDIVLEEKFWEKEANRIKKKFMWWKKRKK